MLEILITSDSHFRYSENQEIKLVITCVSNPGNCKESLALNIKASFCLAFTFFPPPCPVKLCSYKEKHRHLQVFFLLKITIFLTFC